ncbi:hypothetical protein [Acetanaerobacterium elongatum]|uniref:Uncharacterized protein n=1 Tax=Acetanaerobacterium elongatum TaxID=258515 RepID=A0A1H0C0P3_9FIRM|nr:hypothetical protein [Acetanaerobacterium elongatum]SDN51417.1 hypothetical protein SAMN05192585_12131 [Acetanaerobacterium elongatum]
MNDKVNYLHGYRVTYTYGDKDLGDILKRLVLSDLDDEIKGEYNNQTITLRGDKNGKKKQV